MIPVDCKLFRLDVLESARPLSLWGVAFSLKKQAQAGRESMNVPASAVLDFCTIVDPTRNESDDTLSELVIAASVPVHALSA